MALAQQCPPQRPRTAQTLIALKHHVGCVMYQARYKFAIRQCIKTLIANRDKHGVPVAGPVATLQCIKVEWHAGTLGQRLAHGSLRDRDRVPPRHTATAGIGTELERRKTDHIVVLHEEIGHAGDLMHVARKYCGVEQHRNRQATRHVDVAQPQRVQLRFRRVAFALLRHVHMKRHVIQPITGERLQPFSGQQNAIGQQRSPHAACAHVTHNLRQLGPVPQGGIAAGNLHIGIRPVLRGNAVNPPEQILQRNVPHRLGAVRQVAKRAIEVAALGDFQRHAPNGPAPPCRLGRRPLASAAHAVLKRGEAGTAFGLQLLSGWLRG